MPAVSPIPTGPVPDTGQGMELGMVPAIGEIRSGIMAVPTGRSGSAGMVGMAASAQRVLHPGHRGLVHHRRPTPLRSSGRSCDALIFVSCRAWCPEKAAPLFDTFFDAVLPSPARPGLSGVPTPRSHL